VSVKIEGLEIHHPTQAWMQLKSTLHQVLDREGRWNPGSWFEQEVLTGNGDKVPWNMCLANALRFVVRGEAAQAKEYNGVHTDEVEQLTLVAINKVNPDLIKKAQSSSYQDIPSFNDEHSRRYEEIVAVLKLAIEMVEPHARSEGVVFADEVLSPEEKAEIAAAIKVEEDKMWGEWSGRLGRWRDKNGRWRNAKGRFIGVPHFVRGRHTEVTPTSRPAKQFKLWLDDHESRGWGSFWDELLDCGDDDACKDKVRNVFYPPVKAPDVVADGAEPADTEVKTS